MGIYLDNCATTKPLKQVVEAVSETLTYTFGNPSSGHSVGRIANSALSSARECIADFVSADPDRLIFVSGTTEANDMVLRRTLEESGRKLITTEAEHPSTLGLFASFSDRVTLVPITSSGMIDLEHLYESMKATPGALLAIGWVNGETGVVQPMRQICQHARQFGITTLIDAAQAVGRVPRRDFEFDYDYMSLSAHKMNGPKGVGCLILGKDVKYSSHTSGGGQESGRRSGTENLPAIVGFGVACAVRSKSIDADLERLGLMRDQLERKLVETIPDTKINGKQGNRVPTNTNVMFRDVEGMALVARCDAAGVQFSQVSACSTGTPKPSKTLTAMGLNEDEAFSSVRLSLSVLNTDDDIQKAIEIIRQEVENIRQFMRRAA